MPELPEVETTRCGIERHIVRQRIKTVIVRERRLRRPVTRGINGKISGCRVHQVTRRGKYLLVDTDNGTVIIHLGMSGSLRVLKTYSDPTAHDHVDFLLSNGRIMRFRDPRKFGMILWTKQDPLRHSLLAPLGVEPLSAAFSGIYLHKKSRARSTVCIKSFIMDSTVIAGVGNIYASEALYAAGIHPMRYARRISAERYEALARAIRKTLRRAIRQGGTTLRDFVREDGTPGYFKLSLKVYGRAGKPCPACGEAIIRRVIAQRAGYYCPNCQR